MLGALAQVIGRSATHGRYHSAIMFPRTMIFWLLFAALAPLMLLQALWVSRRAIRMPAGEGPIEGTVGDGPGRPTRVVFVSDSPVAGIGCHLMNESVAAQTAGELSRLIEAPVHWHAAGVIGIRIPQTVAWLVPNFPQRAYDF